jgi:hypothetical protein
MTLHGRATLAIAVATDIQAGTSRRASRYAGIDALAKRMPFQPWATITAEGIGTSANTGAISNGYSCA